MTVDEGVSDALEALGLPDRSILDVLDRAIIVTRPTGEIVLWNRAATELYGWWESDVLGRSISEVLVPADGQMAAGEILTAIAAGQDWRGDFTIERKDGDLATVAVIDHPLRDAEGNVLAVVGESEDLSEQRLLEHGLVDLTEHLALALDAGELGTWRWEVSTGSAVWNPTMERLFGVAPGAFDGTMDAWVALLHPDDVEATLGVLNQALEEKGTYTLEHRVVWPDGSVHWLSCKGRVLVDDAGEVLGTIGCTADITSQRESALELEQLTQAALAATARERLSKERIAFLADIDRALATASDRAEVMANVTRAAVPRLGDWSSIYVLTEEAGAVPDVASAHVTPEVAELADALRQKFPYRPDGRTGIPAVLRSGRTEFYPVIDEPAIAAGETSEEVSELLRRLRVRSLIDVPLVKRGRVLGAMQFVSCDPDRGYTTDDVALAEIIASRIAATLENHRLAEHQRRIAATLQASLLPLSLPDLPGLDLAVRYWAAGEETQVGGDFYDVFAVDDRWAVVIGDVCGTGPAAASLTGVARHTIRASAWHGDSPDEVLRRLNHAILQSDQDTFCTALYATIDAGSPGCRVEFASGGHPLPILARAGGVVESIGRSGTLLGMFDETRSSVQVVELSPGDCLVLYTDGVTDVPRPHDLDPAALEQIIARESAGAGSAADLADRLGSKLAAILPLVERNDDIALLVLRVTH